MDYTWYAILKMDSCIIRTKTGHLLSMTLKMTILATNMVDISIKMRMLLKVLAMYQPYVC